MSGKEIAKYIAKKEAERLAKQFRGVTEEEKIETEIAEAEAKMNLNKYAEGGLA